MMNTTRRTFLTRLAAAAGVTALAARAGYDLPKPTASLATTCLPPGAILCGPSLPPPSRAYEVQGVAVKVPSNRWLNAWLEPDGREGREYVYLGPWDGTYKVEEGCTNPAYILAGLMERSDILYDWVTHLDDGPHDAQGYVILGTKRSLNWQMLVDWGMHCDQQLSGVCICDPNSPGVKWISPAASLMGYKPYAQGPRMSVNTVCHTREEMDRLREDLRMHCLSWQSTDPRYRTSYPGIPYPIA